MFLPFGLALQVGGLGDVVTSLSRAVQDLNHKVDIILPKYDCLKLGNVSFNCFPFLIISSYFLHCILFGLMVWAHPFFN